VILFVLENLLPVKKSSAKFVFLLKLHSPATICPLDRVFFMALKKSIDAEKQKIDRFMQDI